MVSSPSPVSTLPPPAATDRPEPHLHPALVEHWRQHLPRYAGELAGTFLLVFVHTAVVVENTRSDGVISHTGVAITSGLMVTALIYTLGHLTGAHFNPAVSLAFAVGKHFPVRDLLPYWLVQFAGAVLASLLVRYIFGDVAHLGAHIPTLAAGKAFVLEIVITFILMFVITAVATDTRAVGGSAALAVGFTVLLAILFAGPATGGSMNPARTFGPALVSDTWAHYWLYVAGPVLGAVGGVLAYQVLRRAENV